MYFKKFFFPRHSLYLYQTTISLYVVFIDILYKLFLHVYKLRYTINRQRRPSPTSPLFMYYEQKANLEDDLIMYLLRKTI